MTRRDGRPDPFRSGRAGGRSGVAMMARTEASIARNSEGQVGERRRVGRGVEGER